MTAKVAELDSFHTPPSALNWVRVLLIILLGFVPVVSGAGAQGKASFSFATNYFHITEGDGSVPIKIIRERNLTDPVSVTFVVGRYGSSLRHCIPSTNRLEFAAGETSQVVLVNLIDDDLPTGSEELVSLSLLKPSTNASLAVASAYLIIADDDLATVSLETGRLTLPETNGPISVKLVRTEALKKEARVRAIARRLSPLRGKPYLFDALTNEISFPPGVSNLVFLLPGLRDNEASGNDRGYLTLESRSINTRVGINFTSLTVLDQDVELEFRGSRSTRENAGNLVLQVVRNGAADTTVVVDVVAEDLTARNGVDYEFMPIRLEFAPGVGTNPVAIKLRNDSLRQGARELMLRLKQPSGARIPSDRLKITIHDDELGVDGTGQLDPQILGGFDSFVRSLVALPDGRMLVAGWFSHYREESANQVVIIRPDGSRDPGFNCAGINSGLVEKAVPLAEGRILVTGTFSQFGEQPRLNAVVLEPDGTVAHDKTLDLKDSLSLLIPLPDGRILAGSYSATRVNGTDVPQLFRLMPDGGIDSTFIGGTNYTTTPGYVLPLSDGTLITDGAFGTNYGPMHVFENGRLDPNYRGSATRSPLGGFSRLPDGTVASGTSGRDFGNGAIDPGYGDGTNRIYLLTLPDHRIVASQASPLGDQLVLLLADGTPDGPPVAQTDGSITSAVLDAEGFVTFIGFFQVVNGEGRDKMARVRVHNKDSATEFRWHGNHFGGVASAGSIRVPILRTGDATTTQMVHYRTRDASAKSGVDYDSMEKDVTFAPGERVKLIEIRFLARDGALADNEFLLELKGAATNSTEEYARVTLLRSECSITFNTKEQSQIESDRESRIEIRRTGGLAYAASVKLEVGGTITLLNSDYSNSHSADLFQTFPTRINFAPGETNRSIWIHPNDDSNLEGPETLGLAISEPSKGAQIGSIDRHVFTLVDDDTPQLPGVNYQPGPELFPRADGGLWLPYGFDARPVPLGDDGSIDPLATQPPARFGSLLGVYPDGRLLMGRSIGYMGRTFTIYRLTGDRQEDPTFSAQPITNTEATSFSESTIFTARPTPDGGAIVATANRPSGLARSSRLQLVRLDAAGRRVPEFSADIIDSRLNWFGARGGQLLPTQDGRIIMAGDLTAYNDQSGFYAYSALRRSAVFRLTSTGRLDPTFRSLISGNREVTLQGIALLPDDRILVAGRFDAVDGIARPGLAQLKRDGELDETFVPDIVPVTSDPLTTVVALTQDGFVLTAEAVKLGYQLVRLYSDGRRDTEFHSAALNGAVAWILPLADGRLVVTGDFNQVGTEARKGLAWFSSRGELLPATPMLFRSPVLSTGAVRRLVIEARFTGRVTLEGSGDLRQWNPISELQLQPGLNDVQLVPDEANPVFFRLRR